MKHYIQYTLSYTRKIICQTIQQDVVSYMIIAQGAGLYAEVTAFVELGYWFPVSTTIGALFES